MNANGFVIEILTCKEIIHCETDAFLDWISIRIFETFRCTAICRNQKPSDMMLNADVSDGDFQSKFGDGSENFQDSLENSDQKLFVHV